MEGKKNIQAIVVQACSSSSKRQLTPALTIFVLLWDGFTLHVCFYRGFA